MEQEKKTIRIFISSPGDVVHERQIAKRVITKLGKEFSSSVNLEALLWEDMPLQATSSFQKGINQLVNMNLVDIAVFILWSRLGSPLREYTKPDGSPYKSGTEYEFDMMYAANRQTGGTPALLVYIKNAPVSIVLSQTEDINFEEIGKQHREAQHFIQEKFYDPQTHTVYGAYHQFDIPTSFEQKLTEHLRRLIIDKIGYNPAPIEWEGNPYVGLRSFRKEENVIFFGRKRSIEQIKKLMLENSTQPDDAASVFVLGESGSGKSSLIRAGLLPDIIDSGLNGHIEWNEPCDFTFSQFRGDVYQGIVKKLAEAFPDLAKTTFGKDLIALKEINYNYLSDNLSSDKSIIFFIDQFEELFTDPLITEEERIRALTLLQAIAATHKVWLFFSMRNDFYHKFTSYPALLELKRESILYDLPKIRYFEYQEIVEEPAKKAGLKWEMKNGKELNKQIIDDINPATDDLPLIEFALSELYDLKDENNQLTFDAYNKIGAINGAVIKYVDDFYNSLTEEEKNLFYQMLNALITPSSESQNLYVRKTSLQKDLQKSEKHKLLIDKLINKRILISGKDANEHATLSIVHEILISSWRVIHDWIEQERYFIDINNHYENLSRYWIEHKRSKDDLVQEKGAIKEAEYFLYAWKEYASNNVLEFLQASVRKRKRRNFPLILSFLIIDIPLLIGTIIVNVVKPVKDKIDDSDISSPVNSFVMTLLTILLAYEVWKKAKGLPRFKTINVSLGVWILLFALSAVYSVYSNDLDWQLPFLIFLKLITVFLDKIEIHRWSKRLFTKKSMQVYAFQKIMKKVD